MSIRATIIGGPEVPVVLDALREDAKGFFWAYARENDLIGIAIPYPYGVKPNYNCSETEVLLLLNPFHVEASTMEVCVQPGTKRLGYVFSLASIASPNHRLSENE